MDAPSTDLHARTLAASIAAAKMYIDTFERELRPVETRWEWAIAAWLEPDLGAGEAIVLAD